VRSGAAAFGGALLGAALFAAVLVVGCGPRGGTPPAGTAEPGNSVAPGGSPVTGSPGSSVVIAESLRYVALGDSYTIGTSVSIAERWPDQLVAALRATGPSLDLVANLAVNGFTSRDVLDVELPQLGGLRPEFVSLLIGVNDVVQGVPLATYRTNVATILDAVVARVGAGHVLVVTTPDYTVTPAGADYGDPTRQADAIRIANEALTALARARGIAVVDIHDLSLEAATDRSLVATDGLHPSGAQYALWVERIAPAVAELLGR
jgi:lysophospholipase L1-like esterase